MQYQQILDNRIMQAQLEQRALLEEIEELKSQKSQNKTGIEKWLNYQFESSSGLTEEFAQFYREYRKALKDTLSSQFELVGIDRGHFYISGFLKNKTTGKFAYISCSDVRGGNEEWYYSILVRSAKNEKDYTGGSNCFTTFTNLLQSALILTE